MRAPLSNLARRALSLIIYSIPYIIGILILVGCALLSGIMIEIALCAIPKFISNFGIPGTIVIMFVIFALIIVSFINLSIEIIKCARRINEFQMVSDDEREDVRSSSRTHRAHVERSVSRILRDSRANMDTIHNNDIAQLITQN